MWVEAPGEAGQALGADGLRPGGTSGGGTQPQGVAMEAEALLLETEALEG